MTKTFAAVAAIAAITFAAPAEAKRDAHERAAWTETVRNQTVAPGHAAPVIEGRNAAAVAPAAPQGIEPYIGRQIEANRRSSR